MVMDMVLERAIPRPGNAEATMDLVKSTSQG